MNDSLVPFRQFVLKVHSRCDLACDHCYVYRHADQSWRGRPMVMSDEVIFAAVNRIAEHAKAHDLPEVHVVLHGGEPLLAGHARIARIAKALCDALSGVCSLDLRIHTNGILLDQAFCELFAQYAIRVGISLDGHQAANDRHRRYIDGRSSYDQVIRGVNLMRRGPYRYLYAGLLCTIDVENDPISVYESLLSLDPPRIDFLLPHATWEAPPRRPSGSETAYGDWLIAIFDRWIADGRPTNVRLFESIIRTTYGAGSLTEAIGLEPSDLVVIETDGSYEQADSLKTAFGGAAATGFHVGQDALDVVASHPSVLARQRGLAGLCEECKSCPVVTSCGGGLYAHRYRSETGFLNPSVYCNDLLKVISHLRDRCRRVSDGAPSGDRSHSILSCDLDALAAGYGGATALDQLIQAQRSLRRVLLASVHDLAVERGFSDVRPAWEVLMEIDKCDRHALDAVLGHPYVRVWAAHCIERLKAGGISLQSGNVPLSTDLGHMASIAIAAAIRAGVQTQLDVPVRDGAIHLPTFGRLIVGNAQQVTVVTSNAAYGRFSVRSKATNWDIMCRPPELAADRPGTAAMPGWQPLRIVANIGTPVVLEDTDPYRDCHQWPPAPRLTEGEVANWRDAFTDAWTLISNEHTSYAPAIAAGLQTIMPLAADPLGSQRSAAARHAFGAVGSVLPSHSATLALLLIHEFQHVKLGAVLDLFELFDPLDARLFHAPWRKDPRPLEGLLQGTYAHVAVTDFWRVRRHTLMSSASEVAAAQFDYWRVQTAAAIETLAESQSLTPLGIHFVNGMRAAVDPWLSEPVKSTGMKLEQRRPRSY
jgi:uncharacterized protein